MLALNRLWRKFPEILKNEPVRGPRLADRRSGWCGVGVSSQVLDVLERHVLTGQRREGNCPLLPVRIRWSLVLCVFPILSAVVVIRVDAGCDNLTYNKSSYDHVDWLRSDYERYSICYTAEFEQDVPFVADWIDHGLQVMQDKYSVSEFTAVRYEEGRGYLTAPLHLFIVLVPDPNDDAKTSLTSFKCCSQEDDGSYFAWIPYLAPSHPEWQTRPAWGRLQLPPIDYHAKNLVHEITHAAELSIWGYFYKAPAPWIAEGLAEYEGLFNTTESNRMQGLEKLLEEVRRNAGSKIGCCESLTGNHPEITCGDVYFGGSFILKYLADKFGEEIHDRLIRSEFPTFGEALSSEFADHGTTLPRVFLGMKAWLNGEEEPSFDSPGSRRRTRTRQVRGRKFN